MKYRPSIPVALAAICLTGVAALAQVASQPIVILPTSHGVSQPLRDIAASAPPKVAVGNRVIPLRPTSPVPTLAPAAPAEDPVRQALPSDKHNRKPHALAAGAGADGVAPPDTNGAAGFTQYVQTVNTEIAVYDKATLALIPGFPVDLVGVWNSGTNPTDCALADGGDVTVVYDKANNRWVIGQIGPSDNSYCIAVSQTDDATGRYNLYEYGIPNGNLPDYPKLAVWPGAYYMSFNMFSGNSFLGAVACAFDGAAMRAGAASPQLLCTNPDPSAASFLPSDLDGNTPPPAGSPNYFIELYPADSTHLGLFKFHVDFVNTNNSTFTGPTLITVASYSPACGGGTCIPQPDPSTQLDSLGDRLMFRNAYRNLGGVETLVDNHSVAVAGAVGVRWYEIQNPNGTPTVVQQGTFAPADGQYRWMGSIAMDQSGDIAAGYSESSSTQHPSVYYTGRIPGDPPDEMEAETLITAGTGSQTGGLTRWGDYSGMSIDPSDDCTFFYTNEYIPSDGSFNWATTIYSFKFNACGGAAGGGVSAGLSTVSANPASIPADGATASTITVTLKDGSGNPVSGKTVTLSAGSGSSTISAASGLSDVNGVVTFTVTDKKAEPVVYTAKDVTDNVTITQTVTVTFTAGAVNAGTSTVSANPASVVANGSSTSTITVTLKDVNGNPVSGKTVTLAAGGGSSTISAASGPSGANGVVTFTVKDTVVEMVTYTAKDMTDTVTITQTAMVTFTVGPVSAGTSTVSATPPSVVADGSTTSTITVTLKDASGHPMSGKAVTLAAGSGHSTISAASGLSGANGVVTFTVKDTKAEPVTYTATETTDTPHVIITQTATVTFTAGPVSATVSTVSANPTSVQANGVATSTITITLLDANSNPVSGKTVTLAQGSGHSTISAASGLSGANGVVTFTVKDATVEPVTYTATDTTDPVTISQTATVTFTAGPPNFTVSVTPSSLTISRGSSKSTTITITDLNGSSTVSLSISGLPSRVSASFNPSARSSGGNSTLTITVNKKASTTTNQTLTITGKNANFTHTATVSLTIQ